MRKTGAPVARAGYLGVLAAGLAAILVINLPGHLTLDSVLELFEGRYRIRQSWAPSFYAWVLGVFDAVWPGAGLYVATTALLLFAALASFVWLRGRTSGWAVAAAAAFVISPLVVIYQAIVWKDVLFANASIVGMVCLAWALKRPEPGWRRVLLLGAALVLLAAAALLRQNGVVVGAAAAAVLGLDAARGGWRRGLGWGLGALVAIAGVSHAMNLATQPGGPRPSGDGMAQGMRVLQTYDLLGAVTLDPAFPLAAIAHARPRSAEVMRSLAPQHYSAERTDFTDAQPGIQAAVAHIPDAALAADWRALVVDHPALYLKERAAVFRWVFLTPQIDHCLPICLGVQGPEPMLNRLGLRPRWSATDSRLLIYDDGFTRTPASSHLTYALLALATAVALLRRRDPADLAMLGLIASALAFSASFFLISIACDYRYLYFLDLAAMTGVLYLAVDPPGARRRDRKV
jgi:hypothetical protein